MSAELWRVIPGHERYDVSDHGRVRSWISGTPLILATPIDSNGRPAVCLNRRARRVHQLVALAFIGPRPEGQEVRHLDGDKTNNALTNLTYGTHSQNTLDNVVHGVHPMSSRTHCPSGHEYDANNTLRSGGARVCRECNRAKCRAWKAKRAGVAA